ncbi:TetR family transcriptional regulator [Erythrobacter sp. Alg231-14]|uniref:TetR family transcriptional regulator n=1 Tax=Erythrobacter sp. Alg231-14 TaxID=1922225 RepID=UPI000D558DD5
MSRSPTTAYRPRGRPAKTADEIGKTRDLIAETAKRLFQQEGYANISIRRLAKEVGCSPMTLYKHFDSKIAILQTLWAVVFRELFLGLDARLERVADPKERLQTLCKHYVGFWLSHPEHYRLVFMAEGVTQPEVSLFVGNSEIIAGFDRIAHTIAEAASLRDANVVKLKSDLLMGAMHGIAHNAITISGYPWSDADAMIDHLLDAMM